MVVMALIYLSLLDMKVFCTPYYFLFVKVLFTVHFLVVVVLMEVIY